MPNWTDTAPTVTLACPLCGHDGVRRRIVDTVWEAPEAAVYQCSICELVFLHPIMNQEEEKAFYQAEFAKYMALRGAPGETVPEEHFQKNSAEAQRRLVNLHPHLRPGMDILEVGSSTGFLLAALAPQARSVTGIEPGRLYADHANRLGIVTHHDWSGVQEHSFDLICAYYVLEHLRDPIASLRAWHTRLRPGGTLAIEVPNVDDALVRFYQLASFDRFYWQKAHYFNYSHRTLARVLEQAGFKQIHVIPEQRYDFSNHIHWLWKGEPGGKGKYPDIFDNALNGEYARCLKQKWLCDTVFAVASKES